MKSLPKIRFRPAVESRADELIKSARRLCLDVGALHFAPPVAHVYNPLEYAWDAHEAYLRRYGNGPKEIVFLGMNPGPFGMVQTGVPFGEVTAVREWLGIEAEIGKPAIEHAKRPVNGFTCERSEVSGKRLWALFAQQFGTAEEFFSRQIVINYCPLAFLESSGRNRTPDKLAASERAALFAACDRHLRKTVEILEPDWLVGIGDFAAKRAMEVFGNGSPKVRRILHPSPANPSANLNWAGIVKKQLRDSGVWRSPPFDK